MSQTSPKQFIKTSIGASPLTGKGGVINLNLARFTKLAKIEYLMQMFMDHLTKTFKYKGN